MNEGEQLCHHGPLSVVVLLGTVHLLLVPLYYAKASIYNILTPMYWSEMIISINQTSIFFEIISMQQNPVPWQLVSSMYIKIIPKGGGGDHTAFSNCMGIYFNFWHHSKCYKTIQNRFCMIIILEKGHLLTKLWDNLGISTRILIFVIQFVFYI